jgi:hypothetical protein
MEKGMPTQFHNTTPSYEPSNRAYDEDGGDPKEGLLALT